MFVSTSSRMRSGSGIIMMLMFFLAACEHQQVVDRPGEGTSGQAVDAAGQPVVSWDDELAQAAQRSQLEAQRLQQALHRSPDSAGSSTGPSTLTTPSQAPLQATDQVRWIDPPRPRPMTTPGSPGSPGSPGPNTSLANNSETKLADAPNDAQVPTSPVAADPSNAVVTTTGENQAQINSTHQSVTSTAATSPAGSNGTAAATKDVPAGSAPLHITQLQLCRRVRSFGVYEPVPSTTFLAGRVHRVIVYVELENFRSTVTAGDQGNSLHQVKLSQQISLVNQTDGLEVWKSAPADIVDESRQKRRDFFVVQLIDIPANLGVGKYQLRVRITDQQADTVDETVLPIALVADPSLTQKPATSTR